MDIIDEKMDLIDQKTEIIISKAVRNRIKRELKQLITNNYFYLNSLIIEPYIDENNINKTYDYSQKYLIGLSTIDFNYFQIIVNSNFPFNAPKLLINFKPYCNYLYIKSDKFKENIYKYKNIRCLCCNTILCGNNWSPCFTFKHIIDEVNNNKSLCIEISKLVYVDIIKKKYLINDINIIEWLI